MKDGKITDPEKALEAALKKINKTYGQNSILTLGEAGGVIEDVEVIPTGSIGLDKATRIGGVPRGYVTEVYGKEASGKTQICLSVIAQAQEMGLKAAFIDAEHALDIKFARMIGVDTDKLLLSQPDYGEQALDMAKQLIETGALGVVVIDSVAALTPKSEYDGEIIDKQVALQARMMTKACRMLASVVGKSDTALLFVNQVRQRIGRFIGNTNTTTGGTALGFYTGMRLDVVRIGNLKDEKERIYGHDTKVTVAKNKCAIPFGVCVFANIYGHGIDNEGEVLDWCELHEVVEKSGTWYSYEGERLGQGRVKARDYLRENRDVYEKLKTIMIESEE